jgi:hypothetical protein
MTLTVHRPARLLSSLQATILPRWTSASPACPSAPPSIPRSYTAPHAARTTCSCSTPSPATRPPSRPPRPSAPPAGSKTLPGDGAGNRGPARHLGRDDPRRTGPHAPPATADPCAGAGRRAGHRRDWDRPGRTAGTGGAKHGRPPAERRQRHGAGLAAMQDRRHRSRRPPDRGACHRPARRPGPLGLEVPKLRQPAEILEDPVAAREAFGLVEQVGWVKAARQVGVARRTLRAAFGRWGMGEPVYRGPCAPSRLVVDRAVAEEALELAIQLGMNRAAERFGVNRATLYNAWKRWGLGRPTVRTASGWRVSGAWRPVSSRMPITPGGPTARSGSRGGHLSGQPSGQSDPSAERCPLLSAPRPTTQGRSPCPVWTGVRTMMAEQPDRPARRRQYGHHGTPRGVEGVRSGRVQVVRYCPVRPSVADPRRFTASLGSIVGLLAVRQWHRSGPQTVTAVDRWRPLQTAAWATAGARAEGTNAAQAPGDGASATAGRRACSTSTCLVGSLRRRHLVQHGVRMRTQRLDPARLVGTTHSA